MMSEEREKRLMQKNKAALDESKKPRRKSLSMARRGSEHEAAKSTPESSEHGNTPGGKIKRSSSMSLGGGSDKKSESEKTSGRKVRRSLSMSLGGGSDKKSEKRETENKTSARKVRRSLSMSFGGGSNKNSETEQTPSRTVSRSLSRTSLSTSLGGGSDHNVSNTAAEDKWSAPKSAPTAPMNHHGDSANSVNEFADDDDDDDEFAQDSNKEDSKQEGWLSYGIGIALKPFEKLYDDCTEEKKAVDEDDEPSDDDGDAVVYHDETAGVSTVQRLMYVAAVAAPWQRSSQE
jgi:hypothetical protein